MDAARVGGGPEDAGVGSGEEDNGGGGAAGGLAAADESLGPGEDVGTDSGEESDRGNVVTIPILKPSSDLETPEMSGMSEYEDFLAGKGAVLATKPRKASTPRSG